MREALRAAQALAVVAGSAADASDDAVTAADAARSSLAAQRIAEAQRAQMEKYRASVVEAYAALKKKKREIGRVPVGKPVSGGGGTHRPRAKKVAKV